MPFRYETVRVKIVNERAKTDKLKSKRERKMNINQGGAINLL